MNVGDVTSSSVLNTAASQAAGRGLEKQDFLELMVAQMRYQDPMSPMDNSDFMAIWAQLGVLDELQRMNQGITQLTSKIGGLEGAGLSNLPELLQASALLGRTIEATPSGSGGVVRGTVSQVSVNDGALTLMVGGTAIEPKDITRIS